MSIIEMAVTVVAVLVALVCTIESERQRRMDADADIRELATTSAWGFWLAGVVFGAAGNFLGVGICVVGCVSSLIARYANTRHLRSRVDEVERAVNEDSR